jgi:type VI secretion system secreted protein Hcp
MLLTITGYPAPIEILMFSEGASQSATFVSGGGGGAGKVSFNDASFTAPETAAGPLQLATLAVGGHINQALLEVRSATTAALLSTWKFQDVLISSFTVSASEVDRAPQTSFSLSYGKIYYTVFKPDGTVAAVMGWDLQKNMRL